MSSKRNAQPIQNVVGPISAETPTVSVSLSPFALSVDDAARVCGCPAWTLHEAIRAGKLSAKKAGRCYVILVAELQRWLLHLDAAGAQ